MQKAQNTIVGKLINSFAKLIDKVSKIGDTTTFKVKDPFNNRHSSERHSEVKEDLPNID